MSKRSYNGKNYNTENIGYQKVYPTKLLVRKINEYLESIYSSFTERTQYNYNKNILQPYIDNAIEDQEKRDIFIEINSLKEEIETLRQRIFKMQLRDLEIEKQQHIIDEQKVMIKNKSTIIMLLSYLETSKVLKK